MLRASAAAWAPPAPVRPSATFSAPERIAIAWWTAVRRLSGLRALGGSDGAGACADHPGGDFELVASKRHDADRHTGSERFLGHPHTAVADHACSLLEDLSVGKPALQPGVGRRLEAPRVVGGRADDDADVIVAQGCEGGFDEGVVVLELAGGGDKHERLGQLGEPVGCLGRWLPDTGADELERLRELELLGLEGWRGVVEVERRAPEFFGSSQQRQSDLAARPVEDLDAGWRVDAKRHPGDH